MFNTITSRLLHSVSGKVIIRSNVRTICTTRMQRSFNEHNEKSGYPYISDYKMPKLTLFQHMKEGYKHFIHEMKLLYEEQMENFWMDPTFIHRLGEVDVQWRFDGNPDVLEQWVVTSDSDYDQGSSTASLQLSPQGRGVFSGNLNTRIVHDGKIKVTGYCNLRSVKLRRSFYRATTVNWGPYSHLVMRVRGDGRNYLLALGLPGLWDVHWNDSYQYVLHTRGGPYWQYVRIPFSKFFLTSKGRIQDDQQPVCLEKIAFLGITASDKIPGHFKLEIDYIGVEFDPVADEVHAYEMYATPHKFHV